VIFSKDEVIKDNGEPYTIFTPYSKRWLAKLDAFYLKSYPTKKYFKNFYKEVKYIYFASFIIERPGTHIVL
jgi:deoxyribodipyrimidine photo-lyase